MVASRHLRIPRSRTLLHMLVIQSAGGPSGTRSVTGAPGVICAVNTLVVSEGSVGLLVLWEPWLSTRKALRKYEADEDQAEKTGANC